MAIPSQRRRYTFLPTPTTETRRNWTDQQKWAVVLALANPDETFRDTILQKFDDIDRENVLVKSEDGKNDGASSTRQERVIMKVRFFRRKMDERIRYMVHNWLDDSWMSSVLGCFFSFDAFWGMFLCQNTFLFDLKTTTK